MARVNVGIDPMLLADQHLIAESVEITMITGGLKSNDFEIKSEIPEKLKLGKGHINFFKNKILYLNRRLEEVNNEMLRRGFNPGTFIELNIYPDRLLNDWTPSLEESKEIRKRVVERLIRRKGGQPGSKYYRYSRKLIGKNIEKFSKNILNSKLFFV